MSSIFVNVITGGYEEKIPKAVLIKNEHNGTVLLATSSLDHLLTGPSWNGGRAPAPSISVQLISMKNGCSLMLCTTTWRLSGDLFKSWKNVE